MDEVRQIYNAIRKYIKEHGDPPALIEIGAGVGPTWRGVGYLPETYKGKPCYKRNPGKGRATIFDVPIKFTLKGGWTLFGPDAVT